MSSKDKIENLVEICKSCPYLSTRGCGFNPSIGILIPGCNYYGTGIGIMTGRYSSDYLTASIIAARELILEGRPTWNLDIEYFVIDTKEKEVKEEIDAEKMKMNKEEKEASKYSKCHIGDYMSELDASWNINCPDFTNGWCKNKTDYSKTCKFKGGESI